MIASLVRSAESTWANPRQWLVELFGGGTSSAGITVTDSTALSASAVLCAMRNLIEGVAMLPLMLYRKTNEGRDRAVGHPLYRLLHSRPNKELTPFEWLSWMMGSMVIRGDAFSEIDRNNQKKIMGLWPLHAHCMEVTRPDPKGPIVYKYTVPKTGESVLLPADNVLHLRGFYTGGLLGKSLIHLGKNAIGLAIAEETHGAKFFVNNAMPQGYIKHPLELGKPAKEQITKGIEAATGGLENQHRLLILDEGMEWKQIGVSPQDAQMIEQRRFQVVEICRVFNVAPHRLFDLTQSSFSNIEHQGIEHKVYTLGPWQVRIEQRCDLSLLSEVERETYYTRFNSSALLRGDIKTRYEAYAVAKNGGWLSADDIRELEELNTLPSGQGKTFTVALNMQSAEMLVDQTPGKAATKEHPPNPLQRGNEQMDSGAADARRLVLVDEGRRLVRAEVRELRKIAAKHAGDLAAIRAAIGELYSGDFEARALAWAAAVCASWALDSRMAARIGDARVAASVEALGLRRDSLLGADETEIESCLEEMERSELLGQRAWAGIEGALARTDQTDRTDRWRRLARARTERGAVLEIWRGPIVSAYARMADWEIGEITDGAASCFGSKGLSEWTGWLEGFGERHTSYFARSVFPLWHSLDDSLIEAAANEMNGVIPLDMDSWVAGVVNQFERYHRGASMQVLEEIARTAGPEGVVKEIERRMETWVDRSKAIARDKITQSDGAIAREVWKRNGVKKLRWVAGAKPCPLCAQLNGQVIGIEESFVNSGDKLEAPGVAPLYAGANILHCPLHGGCVCSIGIG